MAIEKIVLPDFGEVKNVIIVELFISPGDEIDKDSSLMSLESDKAVMDLPSPFAGTVKEVHVAEEDQLTVGDLLITLEVTEELSVKKTETEKVVEQRETKVEKEIEKTEIISKANEPSKGHQIENQSSFHATPSVRAYARELEIDLSKIDGKGPKGRILKSDVQNMIKNALKGTSPTTFATDDEPLEDFSKYGEVEEFKLSRIKKVSGPHLHKSWVSIPHVTHFDEAQIDEMDKFRKNLNKESEKEGLKYSPLIFVIKALIASLKKYPSINSSLMPGGSALILKKFYNIGIAVDTKNGLVVPVIKNADLKGIKELSIELKELSQKAREGKLAVSDLQGASFTISSLGGIGGTAFTPIINRPQVAILGLSKSFVKPLWNGESFVPSLTLPLSLSYDHRVIDGAEAAKFTKHLTENIKDLKRVLL